MKKVIEVMVFFTWLVFESTVLWADNQSLSLQGFMSDDDTGEAVEGEVSVRFCLYETAAGTDSLWCHDDSVTVMGGMFNVTLSGADFPETLPENLYVGITLLDEGEAELSPRLEFSSVPYAMSAKTADVASSLDESYLPSLAGSGLSFSGGTFQVDVNAVTAGLGDITAVTAGTGLTGGGTSGSLTLNVDVGTTAGKIVQLDGSGRLPAVDGSQLTGLAVGTHAHSAADITSGTLADGRLSANVSLLGSFIDSSEIADNSLSNADIHATAGIAWSKIDKTGASVSDFGAAASVHNHAAADITSGTLADGLLSANVSLLGTAIDSSEITNDTLVDADVNSAAAISWTKISKSGASASDVGAASAVHAHAATDITSGTLADGRLSANVSLFGAAVDASEITDGTITTSDISGTAGITDAQVSNTLTSSDLVAGGSVVSNAEVDNDLTISGGTVNSTVIGGSTPAAGTFTSLEGTSVTVGSAGTAMTQVFSVAAVLDFPSRLAVGCDDLTVAVAGANLGDVVSVGVPNASVPANYSFTAWVSVDDTVTIRACSVGGVLTNPASGTFRVVVTQF